MTSASSNNRNRLEQVLAEYLHALEVGPEPNSQEFIDRYPDLADELRSFLANHAAVASLAGPLIDECEATVVGMPDMDSNREFGIASPIRYFGDYELLQELGRGGMGVVYKARQTTLNRQVAIKMILSGQVASAEDVVRFRQEAEAAANLDHPNIAPIYETGKHQGQHYFSMKLIEGRSLRDAMPELKDDVRLGVTLLVQIARAVYHAHQRGVLHRDLKPGNVLLDDQNVPYVTDFGLAKRVEGGSDVTQTGAIVGTPSYMSPEQARAEKSLTTAVDVYSLGAILYELLTGQPPFRADSPLKTLLMVTSDDPIRPRVIRPTIDRDLETIALKCLEKSPSQRYGSALDLADDLDRWLRDEPIRARPGTRAERLIKWGRRHPTVTSLIAVSLLAGVFLFAAITGQLAQSNLKSANSEAIRDRDAAETRRLEDERKYVEDMRRRDRIELRKQQSLYAANMNLIGQAWDVGDMHRVRRLLREQIPAAGKPDLRGFEWYYLWKQAHGELRILEGHADVLRSAAFSTSGKWLVSGSGSNDNRRPGEVLRWEIATGTSRALFKQQTAAPVGGFIGIRALAVSPDDQVIAVSDESRVRILDSSTGQEKLALPVQQDYIGALAFSPGGDLLASGTLSGAIQFWNPKTGEELAALDPEKVGITSLSFSPDGQSLAVATGDTRAPNFALETTSQLVMWNVATRQIRWRTPKSGPLVLSVVFSPGGDKIATGDLHSAQIWNAANGKSIRSMSGPSEGQGSLRSVAFSPDGKLLAACGDSSIIRLWDVANGKIVKTLKGHETSRLTCLAFSKEGLLASGGDDHTIRLWDPVAPIERNQLGPMGWAIQATVFSKDSRILAVADYTKVHVFDAVSLKPLRSVDVNHWCFGMDISSDGRWIATGGNTGTNGEKPGVVKIWDAATGRQLATLDPHVVSVKSVKFSVDGQRLIAAGWGRAADESQVTLWNVQDYVELGTWGNCRSAAFAPDSRTLALSFPDGIKVWDISAGAVQFEFPDSKTAADRLLAFSPDGLLLLSVGADSQAVVWNVPQKTRLGILSGQADVRRIGFAPDSKSILTMSPTEMRLWDCNGLQELSTMPAGDGPFQFTPDGKTLITSDGTSTLWHVATGQSLLRLRSYGLPVSCLAISPDGKTLVEAGGYRDENEGVSVWRIEVEPAP